MSQFAPDGQGKGCRVPEAPWRRARSLVFVLLIAATTAAAEPPAVEHLDSGKVLPAGLPFSEAVRTGDLLHLSGQIGIRPGTRELVPGGLEAESRQTLENIRTTLEAHGLSLRDVVKCTIMLADMTQWGRFNAIYREFFAPPYPARSAFGTNGLALGAQVEVECLARVPPRF
ncbi:MAG: RidA family protein [Steroidobacteraceae bacterium]|jgi:reactive intermediate/imine deaminase|nr:RidA family protein [Steroidobacteraceae bacterium]